MREFKYGVGVIASNFLLNLLLVKMSEKSLTKADFWSKNQKDMSHDGIFLDPETNKFQPNSTSNTIWPQFSLLHVLAQFSCYPNPLLIYPKINFHPI